MEVRFRSLHPKQWSMKEVSQELLRELDNIMFLALTDLRTLTSTWQHKPTFKVLRRLYPGVQSASALVQIGTDDEIFHYVNDGTPAHSIEPKSPVSPRNPNRPSALATRAGYRAKTRPGSRRPSSGGHFGEVIFKPGVWHPGIEPRNFMGSLQRDMQNEMNRRIPLAIERGLARGIKQ